MRQRGHSTPTTTHFGRYFDAFEKLGNKLSPSDVYKECLVIGPGIENGHNDNKTRTYQPFELANVIENAGIEDYRIDVFDIDKGVLAEFDKYPILIEIRKDDVELFSQYENLAIGAATFSKDKGAIDAARYIRNFFPEDVIEDNEISRVIRIPDSVREKFIIQYADILEDDFSENSYDIVVCTILLRHYGFPGNVLKKISESVRPGGFIITSDVSKLLYRNVWRVESPHIQDLELYNLSAELLRKVY